ncbi:unnamed protein product [Angiostrongylus costaricensis]|uniref:peptidylamidoglycolate lyase n=1 Tax=Angiostrongylus costaricensis TaxID=334426 RepID=A0A0R3P9D9_ANGCS|nr:unnamed protein product [Angiostrongylus costaricensis]
MYLQRKVRLFQIIEEHGKDMFYMPHGLAVDHKGNYWVTDVGSHQVHKLDSSFRPVLSIGEKLVPGDDDHHFCMPTDVAVAKNGYFFIADGYCNNRVLKFDPTGKLVGTFGAAVEPFHSSGIVLSIKNSVVTDELGSSEFVIPHSLALIEDMNLICVADRENERVQCFSAGLAEGHRTIPAGIPITSADQIGRVYAIREKKHYLVGVTGRDEKDQLPPQLFVMDMTNGKANTFVKKLLFITTYVFSQVHIIPVDVSDLGNREPALVGDFGRGHSVHFADAPEPNHPDLAA